jgi:ribosome-associated protein
MIAITSTIVLDEGELKFSFIRSPGPGGQNVNKVATAVLMRFNVINTTSIPEGMRTRLIAMLGKKITQEGELIIKASSFRTQERNKQDAINRLVVILKQAAVIPKKRRKTKPTLASKKRRLQEKKLHSKTKSLRRNKPEHD